MIFVAKKEQVYSIIKHEKYQVLQIDISSSIEIMFRLVPEEEEMVVDCNLKFSVSLDIPGECLCTLCLAAPLHDVIG